MKRENASAGEYLTPPFQFTARDTKTVRFPSGYQIDHKILEKLLKNERTMSYNLENFVIVNQMLHTSASSHLEIDHPALDVGHHCMLR